MFIVVSILIICSFLGIDEDEVNNSSAYELDATGDTWKIYVNKNGLRTKVIETGALNLKYEVINLDSFEGEELLIFEGIEAGNYAYVYSTSLQKFILYKYGLVEDEFEIPNDQTVELILYKSVGEYLDDLPYYIGLRPLSRKGDELVSVSFGCDSAIFKNCNNILKELINSVEYSEYKDSTKAFINSEYKALTKVCGK